MLRLGFHYHVPAVIRGTEIYMPGYLGRFIDSLADFCEQVVCFMHSPLKTEEMLMDYKIQSNRVKLINLGPHVSIPRRTLGSGKVKQIIKDLIGMVDVMLIRGPSPLLAEVAEASKSVPIALLIVGDYLNGVDDLPQPRWRKEIIRLWSWWVQKRQLAIAKRCLTFVNSHMLYEQMLKYVPNLIEVRTTTLLAGDFYYREDTCLRPPYRLLYTGRIDRAKGLFEMVEAVAALVRNGMDVTLDLVGWPYTGDTILEEIATLADKLGIRERVNYLGYKAIGSELFNCYKKADVYLLASRTSFEGFPRTIWEAMAHSLPVIATRVGSIPYYIEDSAIIVSSI